MEKTTENKKQWNVRGYTILDLVLFFAGLTAVTVLSIVFKANWLTILCSILGVLCVFTQAKGKISTQFIGVIYFSFYVALAWSTSYYGEVIVYLAVMIPLYIYGIFHWLKNKANKDNVVIVRKNLSKTEWLIFSTCLAALSAGIYFLLKLFNTAELVASTASVTTLIFSVYLLARRLKYNQIAFCVSDGAVGILWLLAIIGGDLSLIPMFTTTMFFIVYDLYGIIEWTKLERKQTKEKEVKTHNYETYHKEYAKIGFTGTYYLAFRDVKKLTEGFSGKALDYGCGAGRSTQLIKSLGFETMGVDISADMLKSATEADPQGEYKLIESGKIPYANNAFDFVFSSFVFLEVSTLKEIENIIKEIKRVLKPNGKFIFITNPVNGYEGEWISFSYNFPENKKEFNSGDKVKLLIKNGDIVLYDYYWSEEDYKLAIKNAGLKLEIIHKPLGNDTDDIEWKDESKKEYFAIYVTKK